MNNTFSSNMKIGSQKSQISHSPVKLKDNSLNALPMTPEIQPETPQRQENPKTPEVQQSSTPDQQQNPNGAIPTSSQNYESDYESDEPEEDISQRKAFDFEKKPTDNTKKDKSPEALLKKKKS